MFVIKKDAIFFKISDPTKRDLIVKELLVTKKNIRDNQLSERTGEQQLQMIFQRFLNLLQKRKNFTTKEITEGLKPMKEGIDILPQPL